MEILKETKYLGFIAYTETGKKTKTISIVNIHHDEAIGEIKWYSAWRQYCFFPYPNTIWNVDCLNSVNEVIKELMDARKKSEVKTVGVIAFNLDEFINWRKEKHHFGLSMSENTMRRYVYRNKRYVCLTRAISVHGYTFDEVIEVGRAVQNPEYDEIIRNLKPCLKSDGKWFGKQITKI